MASLSSVWHSEDRRAYKRYQHPPATHQLGHAASAIPQVRLEGPHPFPPHAADHVLVGISHRCPQQESHTPRSPSIGKTASAVTVFRQNHLKPFSSSNTSRSATIKCISTDGAVGSHNAARWPSKILTPWQYAGAGADCASAPYAQPSG